jgi:hypothetical protein
MNVSLNSQLLHLSGLLQLEQRSRQMHGRELEFLIVNETVGVLPYQQAAFWRVDGPAASRIVLSGVATPEAFAPYRAWIEQLTAAMARDKQASTIHVIEAQALPAKIADAWPEWFPRHALWCPLKHPNGRLLAALILGRADPWNSGDQQLLELLAGQYGQCLALDGGRRHRLLRFPRRSRRLAAIGVTAALIVAALSMPIRRSVIAPAEVISIDPAPVRAPFDGVVGAVHVAPNALVHAGDRLVSLDPTQLQTQHDVAAKALEMARAEYVVTSQQAMNDFQAKARLSLLAGKVEQRAAELAYAKGLLERADLTAPIDGVAVFGNAAEWIGRPVALGERIMQVASPTRTELEVEVPATDAVTFDLGAEVLFFSNVSPDTPARGALEFASYSSAPTADGVMAYTFRARFDAGVQQRLGVKGSAKIYGGSQPLALWLFRRPIAAFRQWLAL